MTAESTREIQSRLAAIGWKLAELRSLPESSREEVAAEELLLLSTADELLDELLARGSS